MMSNQLLTINSKQLEPKSMAIVRERRCRSLTIHPISTTWDRSCAGITTPPTIRNRCVDKGINQSIPKLIVEHCHFVTAITNFIMPLTSKLPMENRLPAPLPKIDGLLSFHSIKANQSKYARCRANRERHCCKAKYGKVFSCPLLLPCPAPLHHGHVNTYLLSTTLHQSFRRMGRRCRSICDSLIVIGTWSSK